MIFVLVPSARERQQRLAVGAYDAITQQIFQAAPGVPVHMQHSRIMYGWPEEAAEWDGPEAETPEAETPEAETPEAETPEAETPEERARACSEAEAALEPPPALRLDLDCLPPDADVPGVFLCPISLGLMHDPVVAADGHSYERSYITRWLASKTVSPKNNTPLASAEVFSNYNLRTAIAQWFADTAAAAAAGAPTVASTGGPPAAVSAETPAGQAPMEWLADTAAGAPAAVSAETPAGQARAPCAKIAQTPACAPASEVWGQSVCTPATTVGDAVATPDADMVAVAV